MTNTKFEPGVSDFSIIYLANLDIKKMLLNTYRIRCMLSKCGFDPAFYSEPYCTPILTTVTRQCITNCKVQLFCQHF